MVLYLFGINCLDKFSPISKLKETHMAKKGLILLLITSTLLIFTSCAGLEYRNSLDESLHNKIDLVYAEEDDDPAYIIYENKRYMFLKTSSFFKVDTYKADVLLAWNGYRYFGYITEFNSYTSENPLFIYYKSWVFLSEDYNYLTDVFTIDNTKAEIVLKDIFDCKQIDFTFANPIEIVLSSKKCPRIKVYVELACIKNQWYISLKNSQDVWTPSAAFIKILSENRVINP